jgi:hypothetical protein
MSFRRLLNIPWEIRTAIWKAAIRPARSEAHFLPTSSNASCLEADQLEETFRIPGEHYPSLFASDLRQIHLGKQKLPKMVESWASSGLLLRDPSIIHPPTRARAVSGRLARS